MRVSTDQLAQSALYGIQNSYSAYDKAILVVNSGKQVQQPSDNPSGTEQAINLTDQLADITSFNNTLQTAKSFLSSGESALSSVNSLLLQARSIAVQAASGSLDASAREGLANQVQNIIKELGSLGNTQYGSQYVFGGQQDSKPPFQADGAGGFNYVGGTAAAGDGNIDLQIGTSQTLTINVTGDRVLSPLISNSAGPPATQSILGKLANDISEGDVTAISNSSGQSDLDALDAQTNVVTTAQANIGSNIDLIDQTTSNNSISSTSIQTYIANITDANLPQAITTLQSAQTAYQAALSSASKTLQVSLLNYLQ